MFDASVYRERRAILQQRLKSGLVLFAGNNESPMNYPDNGYAFRQDSTFLYYFGIDIPGLAVVIDLDEGTETLFGDDLTIDQIIWMGKHPSIAEQAQRAGVENSAPFAGLEKALRAARSAGRHIHYTPVYRHDNLLMLERYFDQTAEIINQNVSVSLIKAITDQRAVKTAAEVKEIEKALDISYEMHTTAMRETKPGMYEREIVGRINGIAESHGGRTSYPVIFTVHGETLHNHYYGNQMVDGDIALNDSGAEAPSHYASDITRTFPVNGKFTARQKAMYDIVLHSEVEAIKMLKPGVKFKDVHLYSVKLLVEGLKEHGLMKGNSDDAVQSGAYGLFMQCGVGHMMGLDVHDMEDFGEQYVGYGDGTERSTQFGLCYLRLARALEPGFVVTVEPGLYFIPDLIDQWRADKKCLDFINYDEVEKFRNFRGIRIEDDILITQDGYKILGKPIAKTSSDVEAICQM